MRTPIPMLLAVTALTAAPAQAQDSQHPQPGCAGVNFSDPRGDVGNPGLDIVSGFLTAEGGDVYANLVVANLDRRVEGERMAEEWFVAGYTTADGSSDRAAAHLYGDGSTDGGTFFEGDNGVVRLRLPGVSPATPIKLWAYSGADGEPIHVPLGEDSSISAYLLGETAEEIEGREQAAACATAAAPATAEGDGGSGGGDPRRGAPAPAAARLEVLATRASRRSVRVTLRSTSPTTVRARLVRAGRIVARGAARVDGRGTVTLTARRRLRPGSYTLRIPGLAARRLRIG